MKQIKQSKRDYWEPEADPNIQRGPRSLRSRGVPIGSSRPYFIEHCTDLDIGDIYMFAEDPCQGELGNCAWSGYFRVIPHNNYEDTLTYNWSVSQGTIENTATMTTDGWIKVNLSGVADIMFQVSCEITDSTTGKMAQMTIDARTNHSGRVEDDAKIFEL